MSGAAARAETGRVIERSERFCLLTHERPDGDALGSLIALNALLRELGKDSVMVMDGTDLPLPYEYAFLDLVGVRTELPEDLDRRTVVYLDCGNIERNPVPIGDRPHGVVLNIDHHHDNTRFGDVDWIDPDAACTTEMIWLLCADLGVTPDDGLAEALYVGLVTDTGRFMYSNTTPRSHAMAASLLEHGVDAHAVYRHLYEGAPAAKLELLGRALAKLERYDDGALSVVQLTHEDFAQTGAAVSHSEGIIDHLRSLADTRVAAVVRALDRPRSDGTAVRKVSLRSTDGAIDVSRIARAGGGGGHPQAAGFSTSLDEAGLVAFLREQFAAQCPSAA